MPLGLSGLCCSSLDVSLWGIRSCVSSHQDVHREVGKDLVGPPKVWFDRHWTTKTVFFLFNGQNELCQRLGWRLSQTEHYVNTLLDRGAPERSTAMAWQSFDTNGIALDAVFIHDLNFRNSTLLIGALESLKSERPFPNNDFINS